MLDYRSQNKCHNLAEEVRSSDDNINNNDRMFAVAQILLDFLCLGSPKTWTEPQLSPACVFLTGKTLLFFMDGGKYRQHNNFLKSSLI